VKMIEQLALFVASNHNGGRGLVVAVGCLGQMFVGNFALVTFAKTIHDAVGVTAVVVKVRA